MLALPSPANKHFSPGASRAEPSQEARPVELPPLHDPIGAVCHAGRWAEALKSRACSNVAVIALASKNAGIIWAMSARGTEYRVAA